MIPEWHHAVPELAYTCTSKYQKRSKHYVPDFQVRLCYESAGKTTIFIRRKYCCILEPFTWQI